MMSVDKNTAPQTTFLPPDGLERRFFDLTHPPKLLLCLFCGPFGQKYEKPENPKENHENPGFHGFPAFVNVQVVIRHGFSPKRLRHIGSLVPNKIKSYEMIVQKTIG